MRSLTPPSIFSKPSSGFLLILTGCILSVSAAENPPASPERPPAPRAESSSERLPTGELITLEQAYDRALASDESIRIAYAGVRKARLARWRALARLEPKIGASIGHRENSEDRNTTSRTRESLSSTASGSALSSFQESSTSRDLFKTSDVTATGLENSRGFTSTPKESRFSSERDTVAANTDRDNATFILAQPLLDLTVFPAYRLGKLIEESAQLQFQFTMRDVLLGVTRAYYEVLKNDRIVAVNRENMALSGEQFTVAKQRFDAGTALSTEVLRADATVAEARRLLLMSQNNSDIARNALRLILDAPSANFRLSQPANGSPSSEPMETLLAKALAQREDYKASATSISQETERRNEVAASLMPRVVAEFRARSLDYSDSRTINATQRSNGTASGTSLDSSSGSTSGTELRANPPGSPIIASPQLTTNTKQSNAAFSTFRSEDRRARNKSSYTATESEWEATLSVEMPLGVDRALALRSAGYSITEAELSRIKLSKSIEREVYEASRQTETLSQSIKLLTAEVAATEQNYKNLQAQYTAGSVTSVDLLVALRDLNDARMQLASDTFDYEFSLRNLQRTTGTFQSERVRNLHFADFGRRARVDNLPAPAATPAAPAARKKK